MQNLTKDKLYTIRWYAKKLLTNEKDTSQRRLIEEQIIEISRLIGDYREAPIEVKPEKPTPGSIGGQMLFRREKILPLVRSDDYPPFATIMKEKMRERGTYPKGWPEGAIVHFTAGRDGAAKTIRGGIENGYTFWCIQKDGSLYVAHKANKWGYHAGNSSWNKLQKKLVGSVSDDLLGIEINAAGLLTKQKDGTFQTWFKTTVEPENVRYTPGVDNQMKGYYETYTLEQQETLINSLLWLKFQRPDIFDFDFVLGHDEVSGLKGLGYWRKNDPGAALPCTMTEFRTVLKKLYAELI